MGEQNKNCPLPHIVRKVEECKEGASKLKVEYKRKVDLNHRPTGCYVTGTEAWINTNTNISSITPTQGSRGICRKGIYIYQRNGEGGKL